MFKKKTSSHLMAESNYPVSLDVCATCSIRVAGLDDTTNASAAYRSNALKYRVMVTTGSRIEPIDLDDDNCHLCEQSRDGETFDVTARRA